MESNYSFSPAKKTEKFIAITLATAAESSCFLPVASKVAARADTNHAWTFPPTYA